MSAPFRPSPAAVVGVIAILVALSGASYAAVKANTIGAKQIKSNGVRADEIQDGSVGSPELGDNSVTGSEVQNGALGSGDVQDGSLGGGDVQDDSLGSADVQTDSLGTSEFVDESLGPADLDGSLSSSDVLNDSLNGGDVQDGSVDGADIAGLVGSDIAPGTFLGGSVTVQFTQSGTDVPDGGSQSVNAFCPAGQSAIGGGMRGDETDFDAVNVGSSRPAISAANTEPPVDGGTLSGWRITALNPTGGVTTGIRPEVWAICAAVPS